MTSRAPALRPSLAGVEVAPAEGWRLEWVDGGIGLARLTNDERSEMVLVEGSGTNWWVTLRGRRIPVTVRTWREEMLAQAEASGREAGGPLDVTATLPGMIVAVHAEEGSQASEGDPLITVEAMKMQNEVRAPRAGLVVKVAVAPGETVATGQLLLRLE